MITKSSLIRELSLEMIYIIISAVFLKQLHDLNEVLLRLNLEKNPFELLAYGEYKPLKYLLITLLLGGIGVLLILRKYRHIRYDVLDFTEVALSLIGILLVVITIILLWIFIDNPIARAAIAVFFFVGALVVSNE